MSTMAYQITSLTIVYSIVYSGADHRKLRVTGLCAGNSPVTGEFPAQSASNAENVSIWWRHHAYALEPGVTRWSYFKMFILCLSWVQYIDGLMQKRRNSSALAMELLTYLLTILSFHPTTTSCCDSFCNSKSHLMKWFCLLQRRAFERLGIIAYCTLRSTGGRFDKLPQDDPTLDNIHGAHEGSKLPTACTG